MTMLSPHQHVQKRIPVTNACTLVVQIRNLADEADGDDRRKLRDLKIRAEALARDLEDALR